jgi:hypothetical protein
MKRFICFLLIGLCLASGRALAQSTSATISGGVTDSSGKFIVDASVDIANDATGVIYATRTNNSGMYVAPILPPGHYHVQVSKIGFKTLIKPDIVLNVQTALAINFTLPVGAVSESITIDAGSSMLNTTDASVSTVVDRKFVENMPLNGRSFQDLISMTPGVVTQSPQTVAQSAGRYGDFSVNGQRTESNYETVDGVSANVSSGVGTGYAQIANSGSIAASTALGTTQSLISVDALQEFRVSSSSYSAEFGRTPGGQFSFTTRSGTSQLHGSAFDYLRNDYFDANNWFNDHNGIPKPALRQNDFGGTVGGPIVVPGILTRTAKIFFFASYEGLRLVQPTAATTLYVPSLAVRLAAPSNSSSIFNAYPIPTGSEIEDSSGNPTGLSPFVKTYSLPSHIDSTSVRLDTTPSPKFILFFRYGDTPSFSRTRTLSQVSSNSVNTSTYTLGATTQFSATLSNEFRIGYASSDSINSSSLDTFGGAVPTDLNSVFGIPASTAHSLAESYIDVASVGAAIISTGNASSSLRQWNITDSIVAQLGRHQVRSGFDYRLVRSPLSPPAYGVIPDFYTRQSMTSGVPSDTFITRYVAAAPIFHEFAAYVQDTWKIRDRISLDLGLRWEVNPPPKGAGGRDAYTLSGSIAAPATLALAPQGTPLWATTWYNFAPRLGVAWTARDTRRSETVVRAGGGVFFDTGNQVASDGFGAIGFNASTDPTNVSLPLTANQLNLSTNPIAPYTTATIYAYPAHLQLPYSLEWNLSVDQALGDQQAITFSYVASQARRLLQERLLSLTPLNNNFGTVYYFPNGLTANYNSLQLRYQRTVTKGVQALASYTWSHSLDYGSTNAAFPFSYGNSDYDLRHNLQAGLSWELPQIKSDAVADAIVNGWAMDTRFMTRTGFPITITGNLLTTPLTGQKYYSGVNYDPTKPVYVYGSQYPGGRSINKAAFSLPVGTASGSAPRNFVRGFGAEQLNLAIRRNFPLGDKVNLQFRAEAFNVLNHPDFGLVQSVYSNALFGQATTMLNQSLGTVSSLYQQGGPRSMQFALKAHF